MLLFDSGALINDMKRNINLQELSRDHHHGLLLGWKIRQGLKKSVDPATISDYVAYFVKAALLPHFREEEEIILQCLNDEDELKQKTLQEHAQIAELSKFLTEQPDIELLNTLADFVDAHIRFEERTLFPHLEQTLQETELEKIGRELQERHTPFKEDYPNEFWNRNNS